MQTLAWILMLSSLSGHMLNHTKLIPKLNRIFQNKRLGQIVCSLLLSCTILQHDLTVIYKLLNALKMNPCVICSFFKQSHWIVYFQINKYSSAAKMLHKIYLHYYLEDVNTTVCRFLHWQEIALVPRLQYILLQIYCPQLNLPNVTLQNLSTRNTLLCYT